MKTLTEKQLLETYGKYRLVAFLVDETDGFSGELQQYANGKIFNCYVTTLEEFLTRYYPSCVSAGYCMTQPYSDEDENEEGSYRWMEDQLQEVWSEHDSYVIQEVYGEKNFFILDDYWQLDLDKAREVYSELQCDYEHVGYMKPSRTGNWYDRFDKSARKQQFIFQFLRMVTSYGDFTCNGAIHDDFFYEENLGWHCLYRNTKEFIRDTYGNWTEVGD